MRRRRNAVVLGLAATGVVLVGAVPAGAAEHDQYSSNVTACGAIIPGARLYVFDNLKNADKGQFDEILTGSYASTRAYTCYDPTPVKFTGDLSWSITATGWGIDGCGIAIPPQFSCAHSGTSQTISFSHSFSKTDGYTRTKSSSESMYFSDGTLGDTTKVCATVSVVARGKGITTTSCVSA